MKKILMIITSVLMFCIMQVNAQSFQLKDLIGKTWIGVSGYYGCDMIGWSILLSEKSSIHKGTDKEGNEIAAFYYNMYLSNDFPKKYDESLLGKNQSGKYIVFERKYNYKGRLIEDFQSYEIVSLTSNMLVVKSNGLTITFEAK